MARLKPLSGFPEFLPQGQMVENHVTHILEQTFELHGFAPIHTRAVETMESLTRKGEIDKEVYVVNRLHAEPGEKPNPNDHLGLHFDLTVPFARYVLENSGHLSFPFRRYQIQKVWRGERPQEGRYREFTQADIDIVGSETLAEHHDIEAPLVMLEALERLHTELGFPTVTMHVNNRKLSEGFYRGLGIEEPAAVLQRVDKYDKIGPAAVKELLTGELGLSDEVADKCVALAGICTSDSSFIEQVRDFGVHNDMLEEGLDSLNRVVGAVNREVPGRMVADLKIARGLDYYTKTTFEFVHDGLGAQSGIGGGGRYDGLMAQLGGRDLSGIGFGLGVDRTLLALRAEGKTAGETARVDVYAVPLGADAKVRLAVLAAQLRAAGVRVDVAYGDRSLKGAMKGADRSGASIALVAGDRDLEAGTVGVKSMATGEQVDVASDDVVAEVLSRLT